MEEWKEYKIGELCSSVCSGGTPSSKHSEYYDGNIPWLNTKEINFNRLYETEKYITEDGYNNSSAKWIVENSVIVAMYGATAGKTAIAKIPLTTNQACCNLTINPQIADYRFVYYHLCNKFVVLASLANGGAQQNLNAQIIKEFPISLPSLNEQKRIASILSSLDDKIEVNRKTNENLEQQAQALFKSWFVDFEPFKNGEFVESELGMIPKGWRVERIEDLSQKMASGGTPKSLNKDYYLGNIKWYSTKELKDCFLFDSEKHISEDALKNSSAKMFPEGTVLMAIYASPTVGRLGILTNPATFNQAAVGIVPKENVGSEFIYLSLLSERTNLNNLASGAAQQNLNVGIVKNYNILVPEQKALDRFNRLARSYFLLLKKNTEESRRLAELRDTLLPKLMSGELKVNEIEDIL